MAYILPIQEYKFFYLESMSVSTTNSIILNGEVIEIASEITQKFVKIISRPDHIIIQCDQVEDLRLGDKVKIEIKYLVEKIEHRFSSTNLK